MSITIGCCLRTCNFIRKFILQTFGAETARKNRHIKLIKEIPIFICTQDMFKKL